jgi:hypothetical protein
MAFDFSFESHLSAMLFLGTIFLLFLSAVAILIYASGKRWHVVKRISIAAGGVVVVYLVALLAFSLFSRDRTLSRGEEKYICELDCHTAYSVVDLRTTKAVGDSIAHGVYYVVTVRTWFDERSTSPSRPRSAKLTPNPRRIALVDTVGREFQPIGNEDVLLRSAALPSTPLDRPLTPGESYTTTLIFDLPYDARSPRLLISQVAPPLLIGQEGSLLHRKVYLGL